MASLWTLLATVGLQVIGVFIRSREQKAIAEQRWIDFIEARQGKQKSSRESKDSEMRQRKELQRRRELRGDVTGAEREAISRTSAVDGQEDNPLASEDTEDLTDEEKRHRWLEEKK